MFTRCLSAEVRDLGVRIHNFIPGVVNTDMLNGAQAQFDNAIARLDSSIKLPAELPAKCLAWIVDQGESHDLEPDLSIRDPYLRELVGLEERAQW
jgi:NAD(P)-dependent dehydrogenase (short-subunit alcohol dehydrogenase family)